jgi:hypothetical protein
MMLGEFCQGKNMHQESAQNLLLAACVRPAAALSSLSAQFHRLPVPNECKAATQKLTIEKLRIRMQVHRHETGSNVPGAIRRPGEKEEMKWRDVCLCNFPIVIKGEADEDRSESLMSIRSYG